MTFVIFDDTLYVCGFNRNGKLGLGDNHNRTKFTEVKNPVNNLPFEVAQVMYGYDHTMVLDKFGKLYACGRNEHGELGINNFDSRNNFTLVELSFKVAQVACGSHHTIIQDTNGKLYTCGYNYSGQLGLGDHHNRNNFVEVKLSFEVIQIACGGHHTLIVDNQGNLYTCGYNRWGQLGLGDNNDRSYFTLVKNHELTMDNLPLEITQVACGAEHTVILDSQGKLYVCGNNEYGQLGLGNPKCYHTIDYRFNFIKVILPFEITQVACGNYHTIILDTNGKLYTCGRNLDGQLGLGYTNCIYCFTEVNLSFEITQVAGAGHYTMIVDNCSQLYTCGNGYGGTLGLGDENNRCEFTLVEDVKVDRLRNTNTRLKRIKATASLID